MCRRRRAVGRLSLRLVDNKGERPLPSRETAVELKVERYRTERGRGTEGRQEEKKRLPPGTQLMLT